MNDYSIYELRLLIKAYKACERELLSEYMFNYGFDMIFFTKELSDKTQQNINDISYCRNKISDLEILLNRKLKEEE